jgi:hypothetical protein
VTPPQKKRTNNTNTSTKTGKLSERRRLSVYNGEDTFFFVPTITKQIFQEHQIILREEEKTAFGKRIFFFFFQKESVG